jgi:penicillin-binding protein A
VGFIILKSLLRKTFLAVMVISSATANDEPQLSVGHKDSPNTNRTVRSQPIAREQIVERVAPLARAGAFPSAMEVDIDGATINARVNYTLDAGLHDALATVYRRYRPDFGAFVAIDPESGAIRTLTSFIRGEEQLDNLSVRTAYPAASVFKIITATAAIDSGKATPTTVMPYNGKSTSLYKSQVLRHQDNKWTRYPELTEAFAKSINPVFARLGIYQVGAVSLRDYADRFGFDQVLFSDFDLRPSEMGLALNDEWQIAEAASGYTKDILISPVHAAAMAAAIVNGGKLMAPHIVESMFDGANKPLYQSEVTELQQIMEPSTALALKELMMATVSQGSARRSFTNYKKDKGLREVSVGGKTGSLTGYSPRGRHDWFVGYGEATDGRKIAYASLVINKEKWYVRSAMVARLFLQEFFAKATEPDLGELAASPID